MSLIELLLGFFIVVVSAVSLLGVFLGQGILSTYARHLSAAMTDATRVMEQLRRQNSGGCTMPRATPPSSTNWDAWLVAAGGGKNLIDADAELVVVTCQDEDGDESCGDTAGVDPGQNPAQVGTGEWRTQSGVNTTHDPLRVTVAVCWRARSRTHGQCAWDGTILTPNDTVPPNAQAGVIESPAMLTTLVTCRG